MTVRRCLPMGNATIRNQPLRLSEGSPRLPHSGRPNPRARLGRLDRVVDLMIGVGLRIAEAGRRWRLLAAALCTLSLLAGCASDRVQLSGKLPRPLIDRIALPVGLQLDEAFTNFQVEEEIPTIGKVQLAAGTINRELFESVLPGVFTEVRRVEPGAAAQNVRAIFVPGVKEVQFSLPQQTRNGNYEVWVSYTVRLQQPDGKVIAEWPVKGYGKSPEDWNPLGARERGLQAAANVALRDAAAALIISLRDVSEVRQWLEQQLVPAPAPTAS